MIFLFYSLCSRVLTLQFGKYKIFHVYGIMHRVTNLFFLSCFHDYNQSEASKEMGTKLKGDKYTAMFSISGCAMLAS